MMKDTGYILALCLTAPGHVPTHDVWITGEQVKNSITAEIGYGHNFLSKNATPDRRNFFENPRIYNGKETITLKPASTDYVYKTESASRDNDYVLSTYMKPGYWSRTSSGWRPVSREGRSDVAYCESATKYAKSFTPNEQQMPAQLYRSPTGHKLEIIPLSDVSRFNGDVKLKALYKMSPLAGAIIEPNSVSYLKSSHYAHAVGHKHPVHKAELTFVISEGGIITVPSLYIGQWLAKIQNKKSFQGKSLCGKTVGMATLSFSRN